MAYIPSHQELGRHPKTRKAARELGIELPTMIGHLHYLWWWALDYAPDGDLSRYTDEDIAVASEWQGDATAIANALANASFIDVNGDGRVLHDWDEHAGRYARIRDARSQAGRAGAQARWGSHKQKDGKPDLPHARVEKSREDKSKETPSSEDDRDDVNDLCITLADLLRANGVRKTAIKITKGWRDSARLLLDRDEVPFDEALEVLRWCQQDDFWKGNIMSMVTFRRQYDKLKVRWLKETGEAEPARSESDDLPRLGARR